jgi:hypothetical protein
MPIRNRFSNFVPIQIQIRIQTQILLRVLHVVEDKNFFTFHFQQCQSALFIFLISVTGVIVFNILNILDSTIQYIEIF